MTQFGEYLATKELQRLAQKPTDLSKDGTLNTKRLTQMSAKNLGLTLFYGTERVSENVMHHLNLLAEEAHVLDKMRAMQRGSVVNSLEGSPNEGKKVLHTATRDFFDPQSEENPTKQEAANAYQEFEKLKHFLEVVDKQGFHSLIQIGIGGSELGPASLYFALQAFQKPNRVVHFISNIDPDHAAHVLSLVDLNKTIVVVVSKSGNTLETRMNEMLVRKRFADLGLSPQHHLVAVTQKGSPMDQPEQYKEVFYLWDYVGGRYSSSSMVGCVPLAFALGMEKVLEFLRGMNAMDKAALEPDLHKNLPLLSALLNIWNRNFLHYPTCAIIPYSYALSHLPAHLQQCEMESNGKRVDKTGKLVDFETAPIIWGGVGTDGQHSFYQLLHQGTIVAPVEFIGFKESEYGQDLADEKGVTLQEKLLANLFAHSLALATGYHHDQLNQSFPGNRPSRILLAHQCTPYTVGMILAYFEHKTIFQGFIWNINSFDQEGVELGKKLSKRIIEQFRKKNLGKEYEKEFPLSDPYIKALECLNGPATPPRKTRMCWSDPGRE